MSSRYPTLGVDFDNAGYPAQAPTPHHHRNEPASDGEFGVGVAVGAAVSVGQSAARFVRGHSLGHLTSRPVTVPGSYQAAAAAATYCFMSFPQVTPGKIWEIMRIGVTGPDPFTALAGVSVLAFRSSLVPQDSATEPSTFGDLIAVMGQVPNTTYPTWRSTIARANERIVLAFKGLANGQTLQGSMDVIEHDLESFLRSLLWGGAGDPMASGTNWSK